MDDPIPELFHTTGHNEQGRVSGWKNPKDIVLDNALSLWVVGDQVRKGAALNAVQLQNC